MPKWTRKARQLGITRHGILDRQLPSVIDDSKRAQKDLQFIIDHTSFEATLTPDVNGLRIAERFYRDRTATAERVESFPDQMVDRLLAMFVGQVFVDTERGHWVTYPGRLYVFVPSVIELSKHPKHYVQPFLFCDKFRTKTGLHGVSNSTSLEWFYENPMEHATK